MSDYAINSQTVNQAMKKQNSVNDKKTLREKFAELIKEDIEFYGKLAEADTYMHLPLF